MRFFRPLFFFLGAFFLHFLIYSFFSSFFRLDSFKNQSSKTRISFKIVQRKSEISSQAFSGLMATNLKKNLKFKVPAKKAPPSSLKKPNAKKIIPLKASSRKSLTQKKGFNPSSEGSSVEKFAKGSFSDFSSEPRLVAFKRPEYTDEALEYELEGLFEARLLVSKSGSVLEVQVKASVGFGMDELLEDAAKEALFVPAKNALGKPKKSWASLKIKLEMY